MKALLIKNYPQNNSDGHFNMTYLNNHSQIHITGVSIRMEGGTNTLFKTQSLHLMYNRFH